MAKPIVDSPVLTGKDAERVRQMADNVVPVSDAYMQRFRADVDFLRAHANFTI